MCTWDEQNAWVTCITSKPVSFEHNHTPRLMPYTSNSLVYLHLCEYFDIINDIILVVLVVNLLVIHVGDSDAYCSK